MSRTYRKYPIYYNIRNGEIFDKWEDVPDVERWEKYYSYPTKKDIVREWYEGVERHTGRAYFYFKMVESSGLDYSVVGVSWRKYMTRAPTETVYRYDVASREGRNGNGNRIWRSHGVGKDNKRLRKKKHRAEARHVIGNWIQGDLDCDIPREKTHDRWDWW